MRFTHPESVEFYFSFRSPYSYLAAPRVFQLEERFHADIDFRPLPPMVERGVPLPKAKALYLLRDSRREARRLGMPFGPVWDPLGEGADRCLAVSLRAKELGLHKEFVLRVTRAIWSEAADVSRDDVLRPLCESVGLPWADARAAISNPKVEDIVAGHRESLRSSGHWGVPTLVFRGEPFWGQDRIVDLELALAQAGLSTPRGHLGARVRAPF